MTCQAQALVVRLIVVVAIGIRSGFSSSERIRTSFGRSSVERISRRRGCLDTDRTLRLDEAAPDEALSPCFLVWGRSRGATGPGLSLMIVRPRFSMTEGTLKGYGRIPVSGKRRMTFRLEDGDVRDVDLTSGQIDKAGTWQQLQCVVVLGSRTAKRRHHGNALPVHALKQFGSQCAYRPDFSQ